MQLHWLSPPGARSGQWNERHYGISELARTKRFPSIRQKERLRALVELFNFPEGEDGTVVKAR